MNAGKHVINTYLFYARNGNRRRTTVILSPTKHIYHRPGIDLLIRKMYDTSQNRVDNGEAKRLLVQTKGILHQSSK